MLASKLLQKCTGPLEVLEQTSPVNSKIRSSSGKRKLYVMHVERLKKYHERVDDKLLDMHSSFAQFSNCGDRSNESIESLAGIIGVNDSTTETNKSSAETHELSTECNVEPIMKTNESTTEAIDLHPTPLRRSGRIKRATRTFEDNLRKLFE